MSAPSEVTGLVETFQRFEASYRSGSYKETEVRREFIDPLFAALGWDVGNTQGRDPASKEVVHEYTITDTGTHQMPDYSFRIGGRAKFFLEAKKPSVNLNEGIAAAVQLRSYSWSAQLPVGVLTDFEELAIYECLRPPRSTDPAATARLKYIRYDEFLDRWQEIENLLSREAVGAGSLEELANRENRDATSVDDAFLRELDSWRRSLAKDIATRNPDLTERELNFAVQQTIDRIVFLRIAEDRGIEPPGQLQELKGSPEHGATDRYDELVRLFHRADERYNSGLFHFKTEKERSEPPDRLSANLVVGNRVIDRIIDRLYFPASPYRFSVFPPDILGQVYEQFLGQVIRLDDKRGAVVEDKPDVRKAGGVYYTPTYIVEYLVGSTLGATLDNRSIQQVGGERKGNEPLRILDPACGSGSFLIEAYQLLMNWYRDRYVADDAERWARARPPRLWRGPEDEWVLTAAERKRILLAHIYGVDIDSQAVEVTKLSLLLKVLEGESKETVNQNLRFFHERALPDLGRNIKCGNSLIGSDFYQGRLPTSFEEQYRINAFDWDQEFPWVSSSGGFDVIVGNPPYRRELAYKHLLDDIARTEFGKRFRSARMDLWYYFVHRGLELLRPNGSLGFIVNSYWTAGTGSQKLVEALSEDAHIDEIFSFGKLPIFRGVSGQHMTIRLSRKASTAATTVKLASMTDEKSAEPFVRGDAPVTTFTKSPSQLFRGGKVDLLPSADGLLDSLDRWPRLDSLGIVRQGIAENPAAINRKTNAQFDERWRVGEGVFALTPKELKQLGLDDHENALIKPYHDLKDTGRYWLARDPSLRLIYSTRKTCPQIESFPGIEQHLTRFRPIMERRRETKKGSNQWWHLHWPRDQAIWESPKVLAIQMAARPSFVPAIEDTYVPFSINVWVPHEDDQSRDHLRYVTGLLNSRVMWAWFQHHAKRRGVGLEINGGVLASTPIRLAGNDAGLQRLREELVSRVGSLLETEEERRSLPSGHALTLVERQIAGLETQIDELVYEIYELDASTVDEIKAATLETTA